jgi:phosphopantothenoylcysteine synthetase/decarboxylase
MAVGMPKLRTAKAQTPSLRVSCMTIDEKAMAHARECVRLAGLTDDQEVRDQLIALARDWIVAARKQEEEDDDGSKVLVFPSAVERSRRHGLRMSLRHAGPRRLS